MRGHVFVGAEQECGGVDSADAWFGLSSHGDVECGVWHAQCFQQFYGGGLYLCLGLVAHGRNFFGLCHEPVVGVVAGVFKLLEVFVALIYGGQALVESCLECEQFVDA